jgi:hypothetical protein
MNRDFVIAFIVGLAVYHFIIFPERFNTTWKETSGDKSNL